MAGGRGQVRHEGEEVKETANEDGGELFEEEAEQFSQFQVSKRQKQPQIYTDDTDST